MNHCVPSWDLEDSVNTPKISLPVPLNSNSNSLTLHVPSLDYDITELTWENGQLAMHGLGPPRAAPKKYTWDKPRPGGTLESIVNQATHLPTDCKSTGDGSEISGGELVNWIDRHRSVVNQTGSVSVTDFLVPCANNSDNQELSTTQVMEPVPPYMVVCSIGVGSYSGDANLKGSRVARMGMNNSQKWPSSSRAEQSMSMNGSGTCGRGRESRQATIDTCDKELGQWFTATASLGSPENTSSAKDCTKTAHSISKIEAVDEERKKKGKSSASTKRSRAVAIHNQSERKRRDKINQRMKTLQKLVPNSSEADKVSMLDEVIDYLKQLEAQVQMMSRMNMSPMMLPLAMQQQIQMPMMSRMGPMGLAGLGMAPMGMGFMDINTMGPTGMPPVLPTPPTTFMPVSSWDNPGDRFPTTSVMPTDPLSAFLACQSQPLPMDAYSRMAPLYQQFQQQNGSSSKN